jgi:hypothetical protein
MDGVLYTISALGYGFVATTDAAERPATWTETEGEAWTAPLDVAEHRLRQWQVLGLVPQHGGICPLKVKVRS